jgi:F-type H+-transporting ATPase subunit c
MRTQRDWISKKHKNNFRRKIERTMGLLGIGLMLGIAALGVGIGQGIAANGALNGMARQPEASGKIQTAMLIALAFMELVFLLTFVVVFILSGKV